MNKTHKVLLKMLKEIDDICSKNKIRYYAAGGTALGAIRHGGFIPWDDDVDIYMTRDEFARFREAFEKENIPDRKLECTENNPEYPAMIPRYVDVKTTNIARFNVLNNCAAGLFIDIFILDPVPSNKEELRRRRNLLNIYSDLVNPFYGYSYRCDTDYYSEYHKYMSAVDSMGADHVKKELEELLFTFPEEKSQHYMLRWATIPHVFPKEIFNITLREKFEDLNIPLPSGWYDYLVKLYGPNWFDYPENINKEGHNTITNTEIPYDVYMDDASRYIDTRLIEKILPERKEHLVKYTGMRLPYSNRMLEAKSKYIIYKIRGSIKDKDMSLPGMLNEKRYSDILEIFDDYLRNQLSDDMIGSESHKGMYRYYNPYLIGLDDDELHCVITTLICTDRMYSAIRILNAYTMAGIDTPCIKRLKAQIGSTISVFRTYHTEGPAKACEELLQLPDHIRESITVNRLELGMNAHADEDRKEERSLVRAIEHKKVRSVTSRDMKNLELLDEIHSICSDNGINYSLSEETLLYAINGHCFKSEFSIPNVMMTSEDCDRFIRWFENNAPENRRIYHMGNMEGHYEFTVLYCDDETARIDLQKNTYDNMHVRIIVLEKIPDGTLARKLKNWTERAAFIDSTRDDMSVWRPGGSKWKVMSAGSRLLIRLRGGKMFYDRWLRHKLRAHYRANSYAVLKNSIGRGNKYVLPGDIMNEMITVRLHGHDYRAIAEWERYVDIVFGKYSTENLAPDEEYKVFQIVDPNIPLGELEDRIGNGIKTCRERKLYMESYEHSIPNRKINAQLDRAFDIYRRTDARIRLAEKYFPIKDRILETQSKGDFDKLETMLEDYDREARIFNNKKMAIYFDEDIFRAYIKLLEVMFDDEFKELVENNITKEGLVTLDKSYEANKHFQ